MECKNAPHRYRSSSRCRRSARVLRPIKNQRHPSGIAVVELAICLPVIVLILLATIEACHMIHTKQDLSVVAYEGARVGIIPGSSNAAVQTQCTLILEDRGIAGYEIALSADPATLSRGDLLTVSVSAPCGANSLVGHVLYQEKTLSESMAMIVE